MRAHPKYHDAVALVGDFALLSDNFLLLQQEFLLLAAILFKLVGQDEAVHGECREDVADFNERNNIDEQQYYQRRCNRQHGDKKGDKCFAGKELSGAYRPCDIQYLDHNSRQQKERVQRPAVVPVFRCEIIETTYECRDCKQHNHDSKQTDHGAKKLASMNAFTAAVQKKDCHHRQRKCEQQILHKKQKMINCDRNRVFLKEHLDDAGQAAKRKNEKVAPEKALAPAVDPGNDSGEPQSHHA